MKVRKIKDLRSTTTPDLNPECKRKSSFINQLYIELGPNPARLEQATKGVFFMKLFYSKTPT